MRYIIVISMFATSYMWAMDENKKEELPVECYIRIEDRTHAVKLFENDEHVTQEKGEVAKEYCSGYTENALIRHGTFQSMPVFIKKTYGTYLPQEHKKYLAAMIKSTHIDDTHEQYVFAGEMVRLFDKDAFEHIFQKNYIISTQKVPVADNQSSGDHRWTRLMIANTQNPEDGDVLHRRLKRDYVQRLLRLYANKKKIDTDHPFNKIRVCLQYDKEIVEVGKLAPLALHKEYRSNLLFDTYTLCECHKHVQEDIIVCGIEQNKDTCQAAAEQIKDNPLEPHETLEEWVMLE